MILRPTRSTRMNTICHFTMRLRSRQLWSARLSVDELHLRLLGHHPLDRHLHRLALLDRRRRNTERLDRQIAFIELRQEHRAERGEGQRRHHKARDTRPDRHGRRSEEHTSELQSLMRISYAVFCLKKKTTNRNRITIL